MRDADLRRMAANFDIQFNFTDPVIRATKVGVKKSFPVLLAFLGGVVFGLLER